MATFKPAYLIHGDDHGRIAERRARLRALAEAESGAAGVEVLEGDAATVEAATAALSTMTLGFGRRFVIVDGAERWKDSELAPLESVLADFPSETTVAFFAQEGRAKAPPRLHAAIEAAGGDVSAERSVKPWELPKWVAARAREHHLDLSPGTAKALVDHVGDRQQRLLRELEKLALELDARPGEPARIEVEQIDELTAPSAERRAWTLADALVAGDEPEAARTYLELRTQGERLAGLLFTMTRRVREAHAALARLEAGEAPAQVKRGLRMPPRAADRFLADLQRTDTDRMRRAIEALADAELASRGGGATGLSEDTIALDAIARITA